MNVSRRLAFAGAVAASSVVVLAGPAFAHVSVQPEGSAAKGGYAVVNFKVPNERDNASTVKLEVNFPADHPLASVQPEALPGWTVEVTKSKLDKPLTVHGKQINEAVTKVTWSGGKVAPGYFQKFPLSIGALPTDADSLVFKAVQTYDNGETVRWIEEQKGSEEPQNPAPVLKLSAAADDHHGGAAPASDDKKSDGMGHDDKKTEAASDSKDSDNTARVLGVVGIVIGVAGVAFGALAGRRRAA
ncbi:YcnI family protein [Streptomyces sp. NPDC059070]|uniref:YcnI family copper-binding membrane protein n=1 Tax=unclassified Streptomyces TaxID=2593676 RepID=UPI0034E199C6